jgi:hypothetical protein
VNRTRRMMQLQVRSVQVVEVLLLLLQPVEVPR